MRILLFLLGFLAFLFGALILSAAKSAIHEIEAFILFVIGAVFISGAAIVDSMNLMIKKMLGLDQTSKKIK